MKASEVLKVREEVQQANLTNALVTPIKGIVVYSLVSKGHDLLLQ